MFKYLDFILQSRPKTSQIVAASPLGGIFSLFSMLLIAPLQYIYNMIAGWLGWNSGIFLNLFQTFPFFNLFLKDLDHPRRIRRNKMRRSASESRTHLEQPFAG